MNIFDILYIVSYVSIVAVFFNNSGNSVLRKRADRCPNVLGDLAQIPLDSSNKARKNHYGHFKRTLTLLTMGLALLISSSCRKDNPISLTGETDTDTEENDTDISSDFDWSTTKEIDIRISVQDNSGSPIPGVRFDIYNDDITNDGKLIFSGATNTLGVFQMKGNVPTYLNDLFLKTNYIGLPNEMLTHFPYNVVEFNLGGLPNRQYMQNAALISPSGLNSPYKYLGSWTNLGVPAYLAPGDPIDVGLLNDINKTLPELKPVPVSHPEYLADGNQTNTALREEADVWVTFVHEGAGWRNALAFYTYPADSPPSSKEELDSLTIIFPNLSYQADGKGLVSGDKVLIGRFPKDTVIGWALIAQGWNGSSVGNGAYTIYSDRTFNPENSSELQQHNVLINDPARNLLLLGFEDIRRDNPSCDQDFNDAVFHVSSNPVNAIEVDNLPIVDYSASNDSDGDNIADNLDDYPDDPALAFDSHYPSKNSFGTFVFEDLWPGTGDYDFNDLVIDYHFNQVTNADNKVVKINCLFSIRAIGAAYQNGFGFQMSANPDIIADVTGLSLSGGIVNLAGNNLEAEQSKAVVIVSDNVSELLQRPGGYFTNTQIEAPYVQPDTISLVISFRSPTQINEIGLPPYNPFIFINQQREKEVHLPDFQPTDLANTDFFGSGQDRSDVSTGRYYLTEENMPWALDIPTSWKYPQEKIAIKRAYLLFQGWAESGGLINSDWYKSLSGYMDDTIVY